MYNKFILPGCKNINCNSIIISFYRVGGVSIGSLIGALWAIHRDFNKMKKLAEDWFEMIHYDYLGHAGNLTYPYISVFSGDYFNTTVKRTVGKFYDLYSKALYFYSG